LKGGFAPWVTSTAFNKHFLHPLLRYTPSET
jgi:hypothetical protein